MIKAVTLFLILMIILGMFGKLRFPSLPRLRRKTPIMQTRKCKACGAYNPGRGPCPCGQGGGQDPS